MLEKIKKYIAFVLAVVICFSTDMGLLFTNAVAASSQDLTQDKIFLKQNTAITCTLSAATMMLRRTAICADSDEWKNITENSISSEAWVEGVGLRWRFTVFGMSVDHGYFSSTDKKQQLLDLLEIYPQGFVIYNSGSQGQKHAVFLCDYDSKNDIFYAADPANSIATGRIPLAETSMAGATQEAQIDNLNAYWFVTSPTVTYSDGKYTAEKILDSNEYNPDKDIEKYTETMQAIGEYYVVTSTSSTVMRYYPSGNADVAQSVSEGDLLYIESSGNNNYGAKWYKADNGYYIFSTNLTSFEEYSSEINKFNQTATETIGTYSAASVSDSKVDLRIDAAEGNNIIAYIENGTKLYIVESGFNSAGAAWLKTDSGYYVKASEMKFETAEKQSNTDLQAKIIHLSGRYSAKPAEDVHYSGDAQLYKVTASALNVRNAPVDGEIIGSLKNGEFVEVLEVSDGWCRIDYNGASAWVAHNYLVLAANSGNNSSPTVSISTSSACAGEKITCTVAADGNNKYKFYVYSANGKLVYKNDNYTDKKTFSYSPDTAGKYYFGVEILSNDMSTAYIYSANFTIYKKLQLGAVTADVKGTAVLNQIVTWSVKTVSISDSSVYVYNLYHNGKKISESESTVASFSYTPEADGEYYITVCLKDSHSSSALVIGDKIQVKSNLSVKAFNLNSTSVKTGDFLICYATAQGGTGDYTFAFYVYKNGIAVDYTSYSSDNKASFTFTKAGDYVVTCYIKDKSGNIVKESKKLTVYNLIFGDVNGDTLVTAADARTVLRHSAKLENIEKHALEAADVNKNGEVTSADARLILRYAAKLENSF